MGSLGGDCIRRMEPMMGLAKTSLLLPLPEVTASQEEGPDRNWSASTFALGVQLPDCEE
jgi:hypothetical protein